MLAKGGVGHVVRRRRKHSLSRSRRKGLAQEMTRVIVTVFEASGYPDGGHAATRASTEIDTPDPTARHRSSMPEI